jgi:hypothetical protein
LLYREPDDHPEVARDWKAFNDVAYLSASGQDRVAERRKYRLFTDMAAALERAITDAIAIYHRPADASGQHPYCAMLVAGIDHIQRSFSWERAAAKFNSYLT